jgi:hypothetical protein
VRIGIDLGGTKIEAIALDDFGAALWRRRVATPAGDYRAIIEAIAALVSAIEREVGLTGTVGVGTPGALSLRTGLIKNSNSTVLPRPRAGTASTDSKRRQLLCAFRSHRRGRRRRRVGLRRYPRHRGRRRTGGGQARHRRTQPHRRRMGAQSNALAQAG